MLEQSIATQNIALVGFANSGKSTLFNALTGAKQKTGNWTGVTVAVKQQQCRINNATTLLTDLPGVSSLAKRHQQGKDLSITQDFINQQPIDCLINVIDVTQLQRQLYLTTQLLELGLPMVVVLNKSDRKEAENIDIEKLSIILGCPVVSENSTSKHAGQALSKILKTIPSPPQRQHLLTLPETLTDYKGIPLALEQQSCSGGSCQSGDEKTMAVMQARYTFIQQTLTNVTLAPVDNNSFSNKLDYWMLHPVLGIPIFLFMMYLLFMFAINIGNSFVGFFDILGGALFVDYPMYLLSSLNLPAWFTTIVGGIGLGIQTVATFIPIIACLFIGLSLLESSGYLARAAFVVDTAMQKIGLPGKAFVPLIVGFGCTVPAVMSARILDNERERITTVMMSPFMSCGARLPVYALFAAAFFPESGQNVVFLLYLIGIAAALFTGLMLKKTILMGSNSINIMELPLYEIPKLSFLLKRVWQRTRSFVVGAGKTIVLVVCVLNFFNSLGTDGEFGHHDSADSLLSQSAQVVTPLLAPLGIKEDNWQASVGIITGLFAKEALVATFNSLYSPVDIEATEPDLFSEVWQEAVTSIGEEFQKIQTDDPLGTDIGDVSSIEAAAQEQEVAETTITTMQAAFAGKIGAFSYLLFILLYTPCAAAMGAIKNEVGTRWAVFAASWSFSLAYLTATATYQIAVFAAEPVYSSITLAIIVLVFVSIYTGLKRFGKNILTIPTLVTYR